MRGGGNEQPELKDHLSTNILERPEIHLVLYQSSFFAMHAQDFALDDVCRGKNPSSTTSAYQSCIFRTLQQRMSVRLANHEDICVIEVGRSQSDFVMVRGRLCASITMKTPVDSEWNFTSTAVSMKQWVNWKNELSQDEKGEVFRLLL